jgi:hypothetical protein
MKKALLVSLVIAAAFFTLGSVNKVYASNGTSTDTSSTVLYGMGGHGGMMTGGASGSQQGLLHDEMVSVLAEKLGLSVDEINQRLTDGETMYSIALSTGLTADEATTLLADSRNQAIDLAVTNGDLTQTQADWMKTRSNLMGTNGTRGMMNGNRGATGIGTCMGVYTNN